MEYDTASSNSNETRMSKDTKVYTNLSEYAGRQMEKDNERRGRSPQRSEYYEKAITRIGRSLSAKGITHKSWMQEQKKSVQIMETKYRREALKKPDAIVQTNEMFMTEPQMFGEPSKMDFEIAEINGETISYQTEVSKIKWRKYKNPMNVKAIFEKIENSEDQLMKEFVRDFKDFKFKDESNLNLTTTYWAGLFKPGSANPTGIGRRVDSTGHIYEGMVINGMMHGYGRYISPDGTVKTGMFEKELLKKGTVYDFDGQFIKRI